MKTTTGAAGGRPMVMGRLGVVSAGHCLAAEAGAAMFRRGGNAFDAAAAAGFALTVLMPDQNGLAGEAPMLIYSARHGRSWALSGQGPAPRMATITRFRELGIDVIPGDGLLPAVVPATVASWVLLLRRFGVLRVAEVLEPAIELARDGFAMHDSLSTNIAAQARRFHRDWPSSAEVFLRGSACPGPARLWTNRDLGAALQALARADRRHRRRDSGLRAAHDEFYRGAIARRIDRFCRSTAVPDGTGRAHAGLLRYDDLATYQAVLEEPLSVAYRGWRVLKCHAWTQGPVLLQSLNLLEGFDLPALRHNSAAYIHAVVECMKLAFADREFYYGDPAMAKVPIRRLLSKAYAARRRGLVDEAAASSELRPGDRPAIAAGDIRDVERAIAQGRARTAACSTGDPPSGPAGGDTTAVQAVDREGNIVSAVTSGGWLQSSPVIPGLGFPLGTRGQMFSLVEAHPNALAALKRPRTTLTPALAGLARRPPHLAFSSPGGDNQDQWGLQFLLNVIEFGMSLQEAVEAPTFWTRHFPGSFHPRTAEPLRLYVESRVPQTVLDELAARGHRLSAQGPWSGGNTLAVAIDRAGGVLFGAASPRHNPAYAAGR